MPLVNHSTREITCKIVYYGPGRSGKTTNLQYLYAKLPDERKGQMISLATEMDRTLFFDFLPLNLGTISGFRMRFQLYTVPGQVYYDATRKLVLRGADGVVFVADSQRSQAETNVHSFRNLQVNLLEQGVDPRIFPTCLQYNKRDVLDAVPVDSMDDTLNFRELPRFEACATAGTGVFATLRSISELVMHRLAGRFSPASTPVGSRA
jgi:signal recognition particle receptor subunit beta